MSEILLKDNHETFDLEEITLHIGGMKCASCASIIDESIKKIEGIEYCKVNYATDSCKIKYQPAKISKKSILKQIQILGYSASDSFGEEEFKKNQNATLINFGIAAFISMNIMMLTIPVYWEYFENVEPEIIALFGWLMFLLCVPVLFINGWGILMRAFISVLKGYPGMETLIAIGALAAFIYSTIQLLFSNEPHLYFDTASTLIVIILFGKYIENHFRYKASNEINRLNTIIPKKIRIRDMMHNVKWIPANNLKENDLFEVHAGELIPADGTVVNGQGVADESIFTGEVKGVIKNINSKVISGCVLSNGFLQVRATSTVNNSALSFIVKTIEKALMKKSQLQSFSDKVARYFVPAIIFMSVLVIIIMTLMGYDFETSFLRALTVLVIACPCALAVAVPVSLVTAYGTLAKNGIFVKDPDSLQIIRNITDIVFDKTGTLTYGKYCVNDCSLKTNDEDYSYKLFMLESYSSHPSAEAIKDFLSSRINGQSEIKLNPDSVNVYENGVVAKIDAEQWTIGNEKLFKNDPHNFKKIAENKIKEGNTVVYYGRNDTIEGYFSIGDLSREKISELVVNLKKLNMNLHLLSGDKKSTTEHFADSVGIEKYFGEKSPVEKIEYIKHIKIQNKKVMMIGDGINDAAALAEADVGIALSSGTDVAKSSASLIIFKNFLDRIPELFGYSKKIKLITVQNFIWAIVYNIIGVSLAVSGTLNPLIAAVMMMISSITVVLNSLRLLKF